METCPRRVYHLKTLAKHPKHSQNTHNIPKPPIERLICMDCADKEQKRDDIQDKKDADALDYLRRNGLPTEQLEKQIADRKRKESK